MHLTWAGNLMDVDRSNSFEIDTGPAYSIKFFENPVYRSELVLLVVASEDLLALPLFLILRGCLLQITQCLDWVPEFIAL